MSRAEAVVAAAAAAASRQKENNSPEFVVGNILINFRRYATNRMTS